MTVHALNRTPTDRTPTMNRSALLHSIRSPWPWLIALVAVGYLLLATRGGPGAAATAVFGVLFLELAVVAGWWRYHGHGAQALDATDRAEHAAVIAGLKAERAERELERAELERAQILAGARCPAWCTECDQEQREADARTALFLAERAARHGHPNAEDVETLDANAILDSMERKLDGATYGGQAA